MYPGLFQTHCFFVFTSFLQSFQINAPHLSFLLSLWERLTSFTGFFGGVCCDLPRHISCWGLSFVEGQKSMPISRARPATATNTVDAKKIKINAYTSVQTSAPVHLKVCTHTEQGQQSSAGCMEHVRAAMFRKATFRMHVTNKESKASHVCCCGFCVCLSLCVCLVEGKWEIITTKIRWCLKKMKFWKMSKRKNTN